MLLVGSEVSTLDLGRKAVKVSLLAELFISTESGN
jgi:hypothetical protein